MPPRIRAVAHWPATQARSGPPHTLSIRTPVHTNPHSRSGFSLLEILVALVLIGLLVGTLLPSVMGQMGRGELNRVVEDLRSVENGAKAFRVDVNRWPGDLEDLVVAITSTAADSTLEGSPYPPGLASRWGGPYLEGLSLANGDSLSTAVGGWIADDFGTASMSGATYLTVTLTGLDSATARSINNELDRDTAMAAGRVRFASGVLTYLAVPTN